MLLAVDAPVITISREAMSPRRIEVHVGELVRWQAPAEERFRLEFDAHRGAHEVISRNGEVHAFFLAEGTHSYTRSVGDGEAASLRGIVVVKPPEAAGDLLPTCPEGSYRVCFGP